MILASKHIRDGVVPFNQLYLANVAVWIVEKGNIDFQVIPSTLCGIRKVFFQKYNLHIGKISKNVEAIDHSLESTFTRKLEHTAYHVANRGAIPLRDNTGRKASNKIWLETASNKKETKNGKPLKSDLQQNPFFLRPDRSTSMAPCDRGTPFSTVLSVYRI